MIYISHSGYINGVDEKLSCTEMLAEPDLHILILILLAIGLCRFGVLVWKAMVNHETVAASMAAANAVAADGMPQYADAAAAAAANADAAAAAEAVSRTEAVDKDGTVCSLDLGSGDNIELFGDHSPPCRRTRNVEALEHATVHCHMLPESPAATISGDATAFQEPIRPPC